jgi:hypothetical protein
MGDLVKVFFSTEQQDLVGTAHQLAEAAEEEVMIAIAYAAQADDGSYEMSWAGDVSHQSMVDALKALIRQLRKEMRDLEKRE